MIDIESLEVEELEHDLEMEEEEKESLKDGSKPTDGPALPPDGEGNMTWKMSPFIILIDVHHTSRIPVW